MSLKAFHVFFVCISVLFAIGFGAWAVADWQRTGSNGSLAMAICGFVAAVALIWYGLWFLRKLKGVSFL